MKFKILTVGTLTAAGLLSLSCGQNDFISAAQGKEGAAAPSASKKSRRPIRRRPDPLYKTADRTAKIKPASKEEQPLKTPPPREEGNLQILSQSANDREYIFLIDPNQKGKLDGLLIFDVSGSMNPYLELTAHRLQNLLSYISDYDWRLGVTLAENGDENEVEDWRDNKDSEKPHFGKLMRLEAPPVLRRSDYHYQCSLLEERILTPQTPNYNEVFLSTLSRKPLTCDLSPRPPYFQSGDEQPLRAMMSAMERVIFDNSDLFRRGVDLFTLIVTNGEERRDDPARAASAQDVKETFDAYLKPLGKRLFHFSILVKDEECLQKGHEAIGRNIMELAEITTGPEGNISICEDFSHSFQLISKYVETLVERAVDIPEPFLPETLKVEFPDGAPLPYRLSGNRLIFEEEPAESVQVKISFSVPPS